MNEQSMLLLSKSGIVSFGCMQAELQRGETGA